MLKIKNVINKGKAKLMQAAFKVMHGDSHFVAIVVAIIVCICLAGIFREAITTFIQDLITEAQTNAGNLFTPAP